MHNAGGDYEKILVLSYRHVALKPINLYCSIENTYCEHFIQEIYDSQKISLAIIKNIIEIGNKDSKIK